jgi:hypothetical protein
MGWDGAKATGPVLYESGAMSLPGSGFTPVTFTTGGLNLTTGSQYVLFINSSTLFDGINDEGTMANTTSPTDSYAGGEFAFLNHGSNFNAVTTDNWQLGWTGPGGDTAFKAEFSNGAPPVPEPTSLALLASGAFPLLRRIRRRAA